MCRYLKVIADLDALCADRANVDERAIGVRRDEAVLKILHVEAGPLLQTLNMMKPLPIKR